MALATTCPHCKTSFKVVADQLKLRRGLVRCGKCQEVFSGVDYLRYIDDPVPKAPPPIAPGPKVFTSPRISAADPQALDSAPPPAPSEPDLADLKTAFFLPETIFRGTRAQDAIEVQPPVPVYIPTPEQPPGKAQRQSETAPAVPPPPEAKPQATANAVSTQAPSAGAMPPGNEGSVIRSDASLPRYQGPEMRARPEPQASPQDADEAPLAFDLSPQAPPMWHDERDTAALTPPDARRQLDPPAPSPVPEAPQHDTQSELDAAFRDLDSELARQDDQESPAPVQTDNALTKASAGTDLAPPAANDEALSARVEQAALKLSRMPEGMDLESQRQRIEKLTALPEPAQPKAVQAEPVQPANGARFGNGLEDDEDSRPGPASAEPPLPASAKPRTSPWWAVAAVLLLVLALLQGLITARNELAVQYPALKEPLAHLVQPLGLSIELPRRYDAVTIESFELQAGETVGGEAQPYLAQALLRNQSTHPVQWPAIELSLTDPAGQVLARKVLLPADYLGNEPREQGFAPRSERIVRLRLGLNQITPNGYSAVLFYP